MVGLALVLAVSACDDNPLAEDREEGAYFRLNPSSVAVNAGGTVKVDATVLNRYGAATNAAVDATPCDAKISAVADTGRSEFEFPERFVITGTTLGLSCLVVNGGGLTDTIQVRVVPAELTVTTVDTVLSGATFDSDAIFLDVTGGTATGIDQSQVVWTSVDESIATVDEDGVISAFAPGTATIVAELASMFSAVRADTLEFEVVAGPFTGTLSTTSAVAGDMITITAGALPFDDDTEVFFDGAQTFIHSMTETTMRVVVGPSETPATQVLLSNLGDVQVSSVADFTVTSNVDATEPNGDILTAVPAAVGDTVYAVIDATDNSDYFRYVLTAETDLDVLVHWFPDGTDVDVGFYDVLGDGADAGGCATGSMPEHCTNTLGAGTWYLELFNWAQDADRTYTLVRMIAQVAVPE